MNKARRSSIQKIIERLEEIRDDIESVKNEEEEAYENLPESLQESGRGEAMSEAIDALDSAYSSIEEVLDYLDTAQQ